MQRVLLNHGVPIGYMHRVLEGVVKSWSAYWLHGVPIGYMHCVLEGLLNLF